MRNADEWAEMLKWRWEGHVAWMDQSKWTLCSYNVGAKDHENESWKTEYQVVGSLQEDDWWTEHTWGTNWVIVKKHPKEIPTGIGTSISPGLAPLVRSSRALPAKQEAIALTKFLGNSFKIHFVVTLRMHPDCHKVCLPTDS